jgi:hypothetical protein
VSTGAAAISSSGDSVTRGNGSELDPDTSEDVRICIAPSPCGMLCWMVGELVAELDEKLPVRGGIGKWFGGSGKEPREVIERTLPSS